MGSKALDSCPPQAGRSAVLDSVAELPAAAPDQVARLLGALLGRPVGEEEVVVRAVGLGLLHQPPSGRAGRLSAQELARLFLAGYGLPAHPEAGTVASL